MITGWGINALTRSVHYYGSDGLPICKTKKIGRTKAEIALPRWNPDHEKTCPKCKKKYEFIKAQESPEIVTE